MKTGPIIHPVLFIAIVIEILSVIVNASHVRLVIDRASPRVIPVSVIAIGSAIESASGCGGDRGCVIGSDHHGSHRLR